MDTIKSRREFEEVYHRGRRLSGRTVRLTILDGDEGDGGKVAFVAAKRLGNAVYRNRCKRVLREAARAAGLPVERRKVILFATPKTHEASPDEVARSLKALLEKVGESQRHG